MSLKFWLGGAASDKSDKLTQYVLKEAAKNPSVQFLVVVPEQICLKTQKEYVFKSENHGILNIDILPFTRLAHRITDEVGDSRANVTTLDDMGKSLLLEHIAGIHKDELTVLGENIGKLGYIEKVKSAVSEFMQYGISVEKAYELADKSDKLGRGLLASKLKDIAFLYDQFTKTIKDRYTTVEETLDRTADIVHNSDTIKNSVIVFDGFTGFTPVQIKLIGRLMEYAKDIHVALILDESEEVKEHELFTLSRRTINQLEKMADDRQIRIEDPYKSYGEREITHVIFSEQNPEEEIETVCRNINNLIRTKGYRYKDIAIISGDIEIYRRAFERILGSHNFPYFIDKPEPVLMNPLTEYVRSVISIYADNFSSDSIFRFLKSGMSGFDNEEICVLENYCIAAGVRGYKKWHSRFVETTRTFDSDKIIEIDKIREKVTDKIDLLAQFRLKPSEKCSVRDFATALYNFIDGDGINEKLKKSADEFETMGNLEKKEEYSQVYVRFMNILDQLCELIPEEKVTVREFGELIDAALSEVRIGILPGMLDYIQIGDLTRSRLDEPKALFVVGANDGIIPSCGVKGGIINDSDKEFLLAEDKELELSPTAREDAYTQRLYLYMMLNAPTQMLYLSYARMSSDGKSQAPSYIVRTLKKRYPQAENLQVKQPQDYRDAYLEVINNLYSVICGEADKVTTDRVLELLRVLLGSGDDSVKHSEKLRKALDYALLGGGDFAREGDTIGKALASALYGKKIVGSVTRLETYANCAYQYFLKYGLKLNERETFAVEANDLGTIFHASLSEYAALMEEENISWTDISEEDEKRLIERAVEKSVAAENMAKMYTTARTTYMVCRIKRIMRRTVNVLQQQLKHGEFVPKHFEFDFDSMGDLNCLNIRLSDDEMMRLKGRIDRVDTASQEEETYVKIIDYKSSGKSMNLLAVYEGRQLQLLTYLNAAMEAEQNESGNSENAIIPAGILYYRIDDPFVTQGAESDEEIRKSIMKELRLKGLINSDGNIAELIDRDLSQGSEVLSVSRKKDGTFSSASSGQLASGDDFEVLSQYVNLKIKEIGRDIMDGKIAIEEPDGKRRFSKTDCKYCEYKSVCTNKTGMVDFSDESEDGTTTEQEAIDVKSITNDEVISMMRATLQSQDTGTDITRHGDGDTVLEDTGMR